MIDASFYENQGNDFGESQFKARGQVGECDHEGYVLYQMKLDIFYGASGLTQTAEYNDAPNPTLAYTGNQSPFLLDPTRQMKPRGYWTFDIHAEFFQALEVPFRQSITRFGWATRNDTANPNTWPTSPHEVLVDAGQDGSGRNILLPYGDGVGRLGVIFPYPFNNSTTPPPYAAQWSGLDNPGFEPTAIPAIALPVGFTGVWQKTYYLEEVPIGYCHPVFTWVNNEFNNSGVGPVPFFLQNPGPGDGVKICSIQITSTRHYRFKPAIRINQTRFGTADVDAGIYRATLTEVGYTDNGAKHDWVWAFGDGATAGPGVGVVTHSYTTAGPFTVAVTVQDGVNDSYSGSKVFNPKRVDYTVTNGVGNIRHFNSSLVNPGDSGISSYRWTFENDSGFSTSTEANPTFNFGPGFIQFAQLRVVFDDGVFYETPQRAV